MTGLDGCARFITTSKDLLVADERARQWEARGCAHAYGTCELSFDVQRGEGEDLEAESGVPETPAETRVVRRELLMLGGSRARLEITTPQGADAGGPFRFSVWAPRVPSQTAPGGPYGLGSVAVGISGTCNTKPSCDELVEVLRTFEAW